MSDDESANNDPGPPEDAREPAETPVTPPAAESPDRTREYEPADAAGAPLCDLCGAGMLELHCRLVCPNCGYMRDCSDP